MLLFHLRRIGLSVPKSLLFLVSSFKTLNVAQMEKKNKRARKVIARNSPMCSVHMLSVQSLVPIKLAIVQ